MPKVHQVSGSSWKQSKFKITHDKRRDSLGYGKELVVNLYDCDLKKISSETAIRKFVIELSDKVIKMKRYGKPLIPNFGHENPTTSGFSLV